LSKIRVSYLVTCQRRERGPSTHFTRASHNFAHHIVLPTGIFYKLGVKANVLFFDARPAREQPWTDKLWVYDLRTNMHFTLKTRPLKRRDLDEFVACFQAPNGGSRWFESSAAHSDVPSYAGP
jgi:type I restriction-modification system DNA methylase subunit